MINKKMTATVLLLASLGLVACGGGGGSTSEVPSSTTEGEGPVLPTEEGKYTLYFNLGAESTVQTLESYNSFFIVGAYNSWTTSTAAEFKLLEGSTNVYYTQIAVDGFQTDGAWDATKSGYQLTVGWNASSNAPADKQGANYTYKADYNALYPGAEHPRLAAPNDKGILDIVGYTEVTTDPAGSGDEAHMGKDGTMVDYETFSKQPPAVVEMTGYTLKVKINDKDSKDVAMPTWVEGLYATGSYDGWSGKLDDETVAAAHKLTLGADGYYSIPFGKVYNGVTVEFMIIARTVKADGTKSTGFWDNKLQDANLTFTPISTDGITNGVGYIGQDPDGGDNPLTWNKWPTDPDAVTYDAVIQLTVTDFATDATADCLCIKGSFDGWAALHALTATDEANTYAITFNVAAGDYKFGVCGGLTTDGVIAQSEGTFNWVSGTDKADIPCTVTKAETIKYTGSFAAGLALVTA